MRKRTKRLVAAFLLGFLTAAAGFDGYMAYHELEMKVNNIVGFLSAMSAR